VRDVEIHLLVTPEELRRDLHEVSGDAFRHLFRARRLEPGQRLRLVDGAGAARGAVVEEVGRATARLRLLESAPARDPAVAVELAVAAIRPERAAWVVEKATELGASAVRFFPCARAQSFRGGEASRLARVAAAALEQSGGATLPALRPLASFDELVELAGGRRSVVLDAAAAAAVPELPDRGPLPWLLVVGPEGGLLGAEVLRLEAAGAKGLSLGPRTLRTETAAIVGAALLLQHEASRRALVVAKPG
jgi:16S rRNA (uracil1498-N3)-methyltransferase